MKLEKKIFFLLFFITIISTWIYSYSINKKTDPQAQKRNIEAVISELDKKSKNHLSRFIQLFERDFLHINSTIKDFRKPDQDDGIVFFIYEFDTLIYWSSNRTNPPSFAIEGKSGIYQSGNGWYRFLKLHEHPFTYFGVYIIKNDFNYENHYLQNSFNPNFSLPDDASISVNKSDTSTIIDNEGNYLFSISFPINHSPSERQFYLLYFLYFFSITLFLSLILRLLVIINLSNINSLLNILITISIWVFARYIVFLLPYPSILYDSRVFTPYYYAHSDLMPSLGELFINSLFFLFISISFYRHFNISKQTKIESRILKFAVPPALLLLLFLLFESINYVIESLVFDSKIPLDMNNIFSLTLISLFCYFIISITIVGYLLTSIALCNISFSYNSNKKVYVGSVVLAFAIYAFLLLLFDYQIKVYHLFILSYILLLGYFHTSKSLYLDIRKILVIIVLFSILTTHVLYKYNTTREMEHRKLLAISLSSEQRDPVSEFLFQSESDKIFGDLILNKILNDYDSPDFEYANFETYFFDLYFSGTWNKYDKQITICSGQDLLNIQPDNVNINCISYFDELIATSTIPTESPELFYVNYGPGENGYVAYLDFSNALTDVSDLLIIIELFPKISTQKLGFPDLLIDQSASKMPDIAGYSYAKYQDGKLYKRVGAYFYDIKFFPSSNMKKTHSFFSLNGFNHLLYSIDDNKFLIISVKEKNLLDVLAPLSYLFILYLIVTLIVLNLFINPNFLDRAAFSFKTRLQLSISSVLLFSFLSIGFFTLFYINNLNSNKNKDILSEKTHSVLIEMEHKLLNVDGFDEPIRNYVSDLLVKFSNVFFTDINLFDLNGNLIATSRPQIFDENLISRRMQPDALSAIRFEEKSLFIQNEHIGKQEYLSAYIPFTNHIGEVIGFINLPYFAKENELSREISSLLVVYINIYVILIGVSLIIAILISNYISRPVRMIIEKIKVVKLGGKNEIIDLKRNDEIGELVMEYNRMINELSKSAELLSKSEREYAWREMAKQIAHEIKNPLTPMKLSVQHLQRAWSYSPDDWDDRLKRFTQTMIEQIESLAAIATEFSDFAKMPAGKKEKTDLVESINSSIILFRNYERISFIFNFDQHENYHVLEDKEQISRVFNNLLKNAVQAIGTMDSGKIEITLRKDQTNNEIAINDNGTGISDEISEKIFSPNFTTKSGGMGLGLAIVKSIILSSGGEISYVSKKQSGTTFIIKLPTL